MFFKGTKPILMQKFRTTLKGDLLMNKLSAILLKGFDRAMLWTFLLEKFRSKAVNSQSLSNTFKNSPGSNKI